MEEAEAGGFVIKTIDELKNTDIPIDNDTLEIFRMFG